MVNRRAPSIRTQLLGAMLLTVMIVVAVAVVIEAQKHTRTLHKWATQEAESVADAMAQDFLALIVLGDPSDAADLTQRLTSFPLIRSVVVHDPSGQLLFRYQRDAAVADAPADEVPEDTFTVTRQIGESEVIYGSIAMTVSAERLRSDLSDYYHYLYLLLAALLLVSVSAAGYFQRFFTRPVLHMNRFMQRVTAERDWTSRIAEERHDEFGLLYDGLNKLLAEMHSAQQNILQQNAELSAALHQLSVEHSAKTEAMRARLEAESANREKSAFLANMSHELRTPLNAIIGYSEILQEDAADRADEGAVADLRKIAMAGRHLLSLINDVLDLSKIEAGKMQLEPATFNVRKLVDETLVLVEPLLAAGQNRLEVSFNTEVTEMHTDPVRLRQILFNLLSNACKFTRNGTIGVSVSDCVSDGTPGLDVSVRDTGAGIAAQDLAGLFQPFVQAESVGRKHEGTGLGLALCRRFCVMMGGNITATSIVGQGSEFRFWLPIDLGPK